MKTLAKEIPALTLVLITLWLVFAAVYPSKSWAQDKPIDPKDATIAAQTKLIEWQDAKIAKLTKMLQDEVTAHYQDLQGVHTQPLATALQELDKQKPVVPAVPAVPADPKAKEKK